MIRNHNQNTRFRNITDCFYFLVVAAKSNCYHLIVCYIQKQDFFMKKYPRLCSYLSIINHGIIMKKFVSKGNKSFYTTFLHYNYFKYSKLSIFCFF